MMASRGKTAICLLRNDLRFADNEVLLWGHRNADHILPLYCFDPRHYKGTYTFNLQKTGIHRLKFLLETVADLRKNLQHHGSNLIIRNDKPEIVVPQIIDQIGKNNISCLVYQKEVTKEETDVDKSLKELPGLQVKEIWGSTLFHKDDLPFKTSQTPDVYSHFRKLVEDKAHVRHVIETPNNLKSLPNEVTDEGKIPEYEYFGVQKPLDDSRSAFPFAGGENAALIRLNYYLWGSDKVSTYIDTRNGMIGEDFSTKFSPWLANGSLSPRTIYWEIKKYEKQRTSNKSTYWVIFELLWRDFFKFVALRYGDSLFYKSGLRGKSVEWRQDLTLFQKWKDGKTGIPYIDANMRELAATGFMSNRGRQNVASFLTKDLKLDWRLGAEWFESQLLDHDVCSNYGNWQYSAGIGNDPRQDRKFNVIKQGTDYDPEGDYIRLWIPELNKIKGRNAHVVWTLNRTVLSHAGVEIPETYPMPVVTAPEWNKYVTQGNSSGNTKRFNHPGSRRPNYNRGGGRQQRGIDYYFST